MLIHTWAATLRWDWPSNSCTEDLKPFLPVYLFLFFIDLSDIFGFDHYFWVCFTDFWDTLTLPRAGWRSDPPSLVYRKSLKGLHKRLVKHPFPLLLRQFHPFQCKHVLCYFLNFFSVYPIICVSVASEYLFFFLFFSVWKWMDLQLHVCLADKKKSAASAVSIRNLDSVVALF